MATNKNTDKGQTMKNAREIATDILRTARINNSLTAKGITVKLAEKREYSNLRTDCMGRISDGTVKRYWRIEVSGNTYSVRGVLKAAGYRWDPKSKVWYAKPGASMNRTGAAMLQALAS